MIASKSQVTTARTLANKVPEVTVFFWIIKVCATTVGETAADFLITTAKLGLGGTTAIMSVVLVAALVFQLRQRRYVPWIYWSTVVLISVVGTLITDNLTDGLGLSLVVSTSLFAGLLAVTFLLWHRNEGTLSIHSIDTPRREAFYWLAILCTFALGTAAGDLLAERLSLGYLTSAALFAGVIALIAIARVGFKANEVLAFWLAYILTRPLGASLGDYLSQHRDAGGLGIGTTGTSAACLAIIFLVVAYLSRQKKAQVTP